jgi:hypothetical protein
MPAWTSCTGGIWPFGFVKVPTPGTSVQITTNTGVQSQGQATGPSGQGPTRKVKQLIFSAPGPGTQIGASSTIGSNQGNVYILRRGTNTTPTPSKTDTNSICLILAPGQSQAIPNGFHSDLNPDDYFVDADNANDGVVAAGVKS